MVKFECKVSVFRNLINAISKIVSDVVFVFTEKGVKLQCMDTNHVGLIMLSLPKATFIRYKCEGEEKLSFSLPSFLKILNCAAPKDECCISTSNDTTDVLTIELSNDTRTFEYEMKLLDVQHTPIDIPARDDDAVIVFPSDDFQSLIKDLSPLGSEVHIEVDSESVGFSVQSDIGKGTYTINYQDEGVECSEFQEECTQLFSLKYLSNFSTPCSFCEKVELRMKDEQPLIIRFPLPKMSDCLIDPDDSSSSYGILLFFLAPKIED